MHEVALFAGTNRQLFIRISGFWDRGDNKWIFDVLVIGDNLR